MLPRCLLFLSLFLSTCLAIDRCGTQPTPEDLQRSAQLDQDEQAIDDGVDGGKFGDLEGTKTARRNIEVPLQFHIIKERPDGGPSNSLIDAQLNKLRSYYSDCGINLKYQGKTETVNDRWANNQNRDAMISKLNKGDTSTINVYWLPGVDKALGITFGLSSATRARAVSIIDWHTMPGGSFQNYNKGLTAVHEIGHWFGLLHPWGDTEGSCDKGDFVKDTAPCKRAVFECNESANTCPGLPGNDPIHNILSYTDDNCINRLTPGQCTRMRNFFRRHRR